MAEPRLTIGMVVRNGERHLAKAIQSFLDQTFQHFRLVICENASTDRTAGIAEQFARVDRRVTVVRHPSNIGVVANLIFAAEQSRTELFCWASHDDVRDRHFLEQLVRLLDERPTAAMACCAVRDIDPDGALREIRPETLSLRISPDMSPAQRLRAYMREGAGTPFYGVFRTTALQQSLHVLRRAQDFQQSNNSTAPLLGIDMVFLADFIKRHDIAITNDPLLHFRRGGISHQIDRYGSARMYSKHCIGFARMLRRATAMPRQSPLLRLAVATARWKYFVRFMLSKPMRSMTWHYLSRAIPLLGSMRARWLAYRAPHFRRLSRRFSELPASSRIIIFGAGKHTRRCLPIIRNIMIRNQHAIVAICDDAANQLAAIEDIPLIMPSRISEFTHDVVLISSDAYEEAIFQRARSAAPDSKVWVIYDLGLESQTSSASSASTFLMNRSVISSESSWLNESQDERELALIALTNSTRR
jgi:glycosyltransferase involved in cell wall biosynthesis